MFKFWKRNKLAKNIARQVFNAGLLPMLDKDNPERHIEYMRSIAEHISQLNVSDELKQKILAYLKKLHEKYKDVE